MQSAFHYDIIGDIHGQFGKLSALMKRMGYQRTEVGFIPPSGHKALFLGDLIDPKHHYQIPGGVRATLHAVKSMVDAGDALCLMGNHELNALYYHTIEDGYWVRPHDAINHRMHQGTLEDFPDHADANSEWQTLWLPWLKQLPFFLDLGGFRAVHATWHETSIAHLQGRDFTDHAFFLNASDKSNPDGRAMETMLKGIEIRLPEGISFHDHSGNTRKRIRVRWWEQPSLKMSYDQLVFPANAAIPAHPVRESVFQAIPSYPEDAPPIFFGHYFKPKTSPLAPERANVACLDFSASADGPLVAYRWQGCKTLHSENFIAHE